MPTIILVASASPRDPLNNKGLASKSQSSSSKVQPIQKKSWHKFDRKDHEKSTKQHKKKFS